jgi:CTP:molybdopterin cytidylyltransferase MocA
MTPAGRIAAIVLAAGKSSRMSTTKPLLPLGSATMIERVVNSVGRASVDDVVVVTGHDSDRIASILQRSAARLVHNAGYESGMFSSVRTGARALHPDVQAFFVLPADYCLVRPEVLDRLIDSLQEGGPGILHPSCCGLRGHPPLISGRYVAALVQAHDEDSLQSFLARHRDDEAEVEVEDLTILLDMDTADDYQRTSRFAALLDAAAGARVGAARGTPAGANRSPGAPAATLSGDDALYLLARLGVPDQVVRHCRAVAMVGEALAEALKPRVPSLNVGLVRAACLLHDMAKARPKHALVGQGLLTNLGLSRLGEIVGAHMVMPAGQVESPLVTEEQVVYLADKLVVHDKFTGIERRAARALCTHSQDPPAQEAVRTRMHVARAIRAKMETTLGRSLNEVLPRELRWSI